MNQLFDDLLELLRLRFHLITHYNYPMWLILLLMLPTTFTWLAFNDVEKLTSLFVKQEYFYLSFYLLGIVQLLLYSWGFKTLLWGKSRVVNLHNLISFLSLTYLINAFSLFFFFSPYTEVFASFVQAFSFVLMIMVLQRVSKHSFLKVILSWFSCLMLFVVISSGLLLIPIKLGAIDQIKYNEMMEQVIKDLGFDQSINLN